MKWNQKYWIHVMLQVLNERFPVVSLSGMTGMICFDLEVEVCFTCAFLQPLRYTSCVISVSHRNCIPLNQLRVSSSANEVFTKLNETHKSKNIFTSSINTWKNTEFTNPAVGFSTGWNLSSESSSQHKRRGKGAADSWAPGRMSFGKSWSAQRYKTARCF